jgi:large subunit ribosomal protein L13
MAVTSTGTRRLALWPRALYAKGPVRTYSPKASEIQRVWYEVDASGAVLGRLATEVARVLRGKHKATFAPHLDTGDHVIVINAAQVVMTSGKAEKKFHYHYSGYPGGMRSRSYSEMLANRPEEVVRIAVKGMLPKGPLGRQMIRKLKIYAGPEHKHQAQVPKPWALDHSAHRTA